jgi:hypothetical protein
LMLRTRVCTSMYNNQCSQRNKIFKKSFQIFSDSPTSSITRHGLDQKHNNQLTLRRYHEMTSIFQSSSPSTPDGFVNPFSSTRAWSKSFFLKYVRRFFFPWNPLWCKH